jgi:hypothetical protein
VLGADVRERLVGVFVVVTNLRPGFGRGFGHGDGLWYRRIIFLMVLIGSYAATFSIPLRAKTVPRKKRRL